MVQLYWSRQHVCRVNDWFPIFAKKKRVYGSVVKRMDIWKLLEKLYLRPQDPTCNSSSLRPCLPHLMASQPKQQVQWSSREARSCYRDLGCFAPNPGSAICSVCSRNWKCCVHSGILKADVWLKDSGMMLFEQNRKRKWGCDVLCLRLYFWEASATKNLLCINFEG